MPPDWQTWCRLCGKTNVENAIMTIEAIPKLIFLIHKHFSISVSIFDRKIYHKVSSNSSNVYFFVFIQQLTESDCASNLCGKCHNFIGQLEQFTERCVKVHSLFNSLISTSDLEIDAVYLQTLRCEAGLDRDGHGDEVSIRFNSCNCTIEIQLCVNAQHLCVE